jgi:hypothetical protein
MRNAPLCLHCVLLRNEHENILIRMRTGLLDCHPVKSGGFAASAAAQYQLQ